MSPTRQDAWSQDEDLLLAEVVLRHIREGGTQLQAFEEVGKKLFRTSAACGFRWNSFVRKQYKSGIELAKRQRKELKKQIVPEDSMQEEELSAGEERTVPAPEVLSNSPITFQTVLHFLEGLYKKAEISASFEEDREKSIEKIKELEKKTFYLAAENERLTKNLKEIEEDYRSLIEIMEKARKMVVQDEDRQQKVKFQMDKNGNLERVEK